MRRVRPFEPFSAICLVLVLAVLAATSALVVAQPPGCTVAIGNGAPPVEVDLAGPGTCGFLQFSWKAFLAMNWPPLPVEPDNAMRLARGLPDPARVIGATATGDHPTAWEQYQPNWYLFAPLNPPPPAAGDDSFAAWNQHAQLPAACGPRQPSPGTKILSSISKFDPMPGVNQAFSAPLLDQNGYYVRYEIRFNYPAFNYVNRNQYYLQPAQLAAIAQGKTFSFPVQSGQAAGAVFLKAAWKTLSAAELNGGRFHTSQVFMYTPTTPSQAQSTCVGPVTVGLVGLHIVQKTANFPKQIWATFEHVDNVPDPPATPSDRRWSFFDPASSKPANQKASCPSTGAPCDWQPTSSHLNDATGGPTQVTRLNPLSASPNQPALDQINAAMRSALAQVNPKSVWQFYRLVEAQWERGDTPTGFFPPSRVANVTLETYHQSGNNASCMECHRVAKAIDNQAAADFSFELQLAWKPVVLPPGP